MVTCKINESRCRENKFGPSATALCVWACFFSLLAEKIGGWGKSRAQMENTLRTGFKSKSDSSGRRKTQRDDTGGDGSIFMLQIVVSYFS